MALPTPQQQADIAAIYAAFWERAPDPEGFGYWVDLYANGMALDTIADAFRDLPEGQAAYPIYQTGAQFVAQVYENVFNREPDAAGAAYWLNLLTTGGYTEGQLVTLMVDSAVAQAATGNTDGLLFQNKTYIGNWTVQNVLNGNVTPEQEAVITTNAFRYVTSDASSIPTSQTYLSHLPTGTPYNLTINQDVFNGVAGNDLFISNLAGTSGEANTLTLGDRLNGGEGWDVLDATLSASVAAGLFTVQAIEEVQLSAAGTAIGVDNAFAGVEVIQFEDTAGYNLTVTASGAVDASVYNVADAVFTLNTATSAAQDLVLDTADNVSIQLNNNGSDVLNITAQGGASTDITVGGEASVATELNVVAAANLDFAGLTLAELTDLTISGIADVTIAGGAEIALASSANSQITIDATEATGDVALDLANAGTASLVADFGIGNDTFDISANTAWTSGTGSLVDVNMGAGDDVLTALYSLPGNTIVTLDGGLGSNDTLDLTGVQTTQELNAIDLNRFGVVQGFETLAFDSALITLSGGVATLTLSADFDNVDFSAADIASGTTGGLAIANAADNIIVDFSGVTMATGAFATSVEFDLSVDGAGDVTLNFNDNVYVVAGASFANDWDFAEANTLSLNIADTTNGDDVRIDFTDGSASSASFVAASLETIDITGGSVASSFTFDIAGADLTTTSDLSALTTVDISAFAGTVTLDFAAGDVIENTLTFVLNDGIVGAATVATITGSDNTDVYEFASELDGTVYITNFYNNGGFANGDKLDLSAFGITSESQLDVTYDSSSMNYAIITADNGQFAGSIRVDLEFATALVRGDFIFA